MYFVPYSPRYGRRHNRCTAELNKQTNKCPVRLSPRHVSANRYDPRTTIAAKREQDGAPSPPRRSHTHAQPQAPASACVSPVISRAWSARQRTVAEWHSEPGAGWGAPGREKVGRFLLLKRDASARRMGGGLAIANRSLRRTDDRVRQVGSRQQFLHPPLPPVGYCCRHSV